MQANGNYSGLPRGITMNRINSTMLRPIAALLIMSMAGSVFAAPVESDVACLAEDDFVFLRPTESEGVFLQFGDIAVYDGAEIADWWPTFPVHA